MNFAEWIKPYYALRRPLDRAQAFAAFVRACALFDNPQEAFEAVHVGGTNGKGSVSNGVAKGLALDGKRTGLYTSPHLQSFCERIQIDGEIISESDVRRLGPLVLKKTKKAGIGLNFFEWATLLALLYFREQKIDIGVFEVGIGGLFDPTRVVSPSVCAIVSIGKEHTEMLGTTYEEIAEQKAGIIKEGASVVLGPSAAPWIKGDFVIEKGINYLDENRRMIEKVLELLEVSSKSIAIAKETRIPGRFEQIAPDIFFDVAHNPPGFEALAKLLEGDDWEVLVGLCDDKDPCKCLKPLLKKTKRFHFVEVPGDRKLPAASMLKAAGAVKAVSYSSIEEGAQSWFESKRPRLACGSLYLFGPVMQFLKHRLSIT